MSATFSRTSIKSTAVIPERPEMPVYYASVCHQQTSAAGRSTRKSHTRDGARTRLLHDRHAKFLPVFDPILTLRVSP